MAHSYGNNGLQIGVFWKFYQADIFWKTISEGEAGEERRGGERSARKVPAGPTASPVLLATTRPLKADATPAGMTGRWGDRSQARILFFAIIPKQSGKVKHFVMSVFWFSPAGWVHPHGTSGDPVLPGVPGGCDWRGRTIGRRWKDTGPVARLAPGWYYLKIRPKNFARRFLFLPCLFGTVSSA